MHADAKPALWRTVLATVLACAAIGMAGCPLTYQVAPGDWIIHLSLFPAHITHGLTLEEDGDAIPYENTPGYGALPGTWTWATNGHNIWFVQNNNGNFFTYYGERLSETSAAGDTYEGSYNGNTGEAIGTWEAVLDE